MMHRSDDPEQRFTHLAIAIAIVIVIAMLFVFTIDRSGNLPNIIITLLFWLIFLVSAKVGYKIAGAYF